MMGLGTRPGIDDGGGGGGGAAFKYAWLPMMELGSVELVIIFSPLTYFFTELNPG